jgi:hypothetical protein
LRGYSYSERAIGVFVPGLVDDEHVNDNYRLEKLQSDGTFTRSVSDLSDFGSIFHAHSFGSLRIADGRTIYE